jgi:hypothetical protein
VQLSSELVTAHDTIRRQRRQLLRMAAALRVSQQGNEVLVDLLDELMASEPGEG